MAAVLSASVNPGNADTGSSVFSLLWSLVVCIRLFFLPVVRCRILHAMVQSDLSPEERNP